MLMGMSILGHAQESLNMRPSWRTHLTLSPSVDVVSTHGQFYAHGSLEYYFEEGYSISGEFLSSLLDVTAISNKQVSAGATKHWVQKQNDWFIGFQPGVFVIDSEESVEGSRVLPQSSVVMGYNFFMHDYFHFFAHVRSTYRQVPAANNREQLDFSLSLGLGFNGPRKD